MSLALFTSLRSLAVSTTLLLTAALSSLASAQIIGSDDGPLSPDLSNGYSGYFTTIDDKTNKPKSILRVTVKDDMLYAQVVKLLTKPQDSLCEKCPDNLKNKPVRGMYVINGLKRDGDEFSRGEILDPENGKTYKARVWPDEGNLKVRGYLGIFYRTQEWKANKNYVPETPVKAAPGPDNSEPANAADT
ncbi:Uncharacterised protein [BD1-7 clade bacterium]|uniref:DUF2147 domain-containing protein n=1 Tax=BD1-7 clade bacterium TaxID=2029982 RepID=A0A5S9N3N5_9GAMM|nr:Uncharacterised protein [BD1-7 clade bacterium]CAA0084464.1 Uncharacterised protein [BD1-7 clade bacterium]